MGNTKDLRKQSSAPTTPSEAGKVVLYANSSGQLNIINSAGTVVPVAGAFTQNISQAGGSFLNAGSTGLYQGTGYYGQTGNGVFAFTTFLAVPNQWLVAVGSSGQKLVIPAYNYV